MRRDLTASLLAVLGSLSLGRIERLLAAMLEQSEFELVRFQNQPSKGGASNAGRQYPHAGRNQDRHAWPEWSPSM